MLWRSRRSKQERAPQFDATEMTSQAENARTSEPSERAPSPGPSPEDVQELLSEASIEARRVATLKAVAAPVPKPMRGPVSLATMRGGTPKNLNRAHAQALYRFLIQSHGGEVLTARKVVDKYVGMCEELRTPPRPFQRVLHELAEMLAPRGSKGRAARPQRTIHEANAEGTWDARTERYYAIPRPIRRTR